MGRTARQIEAIGETVLLAERLRVEVWLRGGWAMDFFLGKITRDHVDVDWFAWATDTATLATALTTRGCVLRPDPPHDQQFDLAKGDVEISLALIAKDETGRVVVAGGPWAGEPWPEDMLPGEMGHLRALRCRIIRPQAQIEIKRMTPVWVPGRPRRAKDANDIAQLTVALGRSGEWTS